jgi:hypothetical protein
VIKTLRNAHFLICCVEQRSDDSTAVPKYITWYWNFVLHISRHESVVFDGQQCIFFLVITKRCVTNEVTILSSSFSICHFCYTFRRSDSGDLYLACYLPVLHHPLRLFGSVILSDTESSRVKYQTLPQGLWSIWDSGTFMNIMTQKLIY